MEKLAVGLMSGTSLDGIDAALVKISGYGTDTKVQLLHFATVPIPTDTEREILQIMELKSSNVALICSLNFKLGALFAKAVKTVCMQAGIPFEKLNFIASHGQTIFHLPNQLENYMKSTLQIGEPAIIAYETGVTVVSNFRTMDMAAGGEGAPLVPYTDYLLYRSEEKGRALQNVGGIGNVTVLPKGGSLEDIIAFDTGPGNMIIDALCKHFKGISYDHDGEWAAKGRIHQDIAESWLQLAFFEEVPPKSTGRELFGAHYTEKLIETYSYLSANDLIATATYFTALSIANAYERFIFPKTQIDELIIGGGGSHNKTLLTMLRKLLPDLTILTQEDIGFSSDAKEAIAFAILANETLNGQPSNAPEATGASKRVILGSITYPTIRN
ncbi:anhydro-N-acetylmuramic acid kinase AnmK [Lederbergia lenta]|uniref:Anhydro-N-acetylmuramic acid kinase n=1 Tax=Lederbergia lenta TaxID=1467 RepID=A0A2X4WUI9_LEDLE|nr:anhydro-N-acetylmuramic acid kinase AnmK [Lederbergia lenta]MEC2323359.1 anhydro-N-acetylmuramic acid kinase AnmK [Lederbergia lenta]SQI63278.1 anhydro-N-acetylmuramic acid kinase [Lederbergia lenta]